jgi:hypothetical protein
MDSEENEARNAGEGQQQFNRPTESDHPWSSVVICCCEKLGAEAGTVREPRGSGTSAVGNRYQATDSEDYSRLRRPRVSYSDL